jgi:RimJ/RimL family protein N-acetyltransferase
MAASTESVRERALRLEAFQPAAAERIVSWVGGAQEAYWLAPRTAPPLTVEKVRSWAHPLHEPLVLVDGEAAPLGYGELNVLAGGDRVWWLGHLIIDPAHRGRGLGTELTRRLLLRAFQQRGASRVTLVVFAENTAAIASYRRAGLRFDGYESHKFPAYGRCERLMRMAVNAREYWAGRT